MKCRRHPYELGPGVCATCLRERLLALIAARDGRHSPERSTNSLSSPSPRNLRRFFSTPQVNHTSKDGNKSSLFHTLFGYSKSDEIQPSRSWISKLMNLKKRSKSKESKSTCKIRDDRGMSPTRGDENSCSSGYSTDSSTSWRRPEPTPLRKFNNPIRSGSGLSGFSVCLSPLVRPNSTKFNGDEVRGACRTHIRRHKSAAGSGLVHNGSKKLADYGRFR